MELPRLRTNTSRSKKSSITQINESEESLLKRIEELEEENKRLKEGWLFGRVKPSIINITLISIGTILLILSYIYSSLVLTFTAIALIFWGIVIYYTTSTRYVTEEVFNSISLSMIISIDRLVTALGYNSNSIFFYPKNLSGLKQGYIFISSNQDHKLPEIDSIEGKTFYDTPAGLIILAPAYGLVELFEKKLNTNLAIEDMEFLKKNLPNLITKDLMLADDLIIQEDKDTVNVTIKGRSAAELCSLINRATKIGNHLGCPLCSSLALVFSKVSASPFIIKENRVREDTIENIYVRLQ